MFDPLNPTPEEQDEMIQGYSDGLRGFIRKGKSSAYRHGHRVGTNNKGGKVEPFQSLLIERMKRKEGIREHKEGLG